MTFAYFRVGTVAQTIKPYDPKNYNFFYSQADIDKELGCIGHLRGDFGSSGREFHTTWWPHCEDFKTQEFRDEFDNLINSLRGDEVLKDRTTMSAFCHKNPDAEIKNIMGYTYGFEITSEKYAYFLRCFTEKGDYNFYCYCYDKAQLTAYLNKQGEKA